MCLWVVPWVEDHLVLVLIVHFPVHPLESVVIWDLTEVLLVGVVISHIGLSGIVILVHVKAVLGRDIALEIHIACDRIW